MGVIAMSQRVCVLHVNSSSAASTSPTMRIARFAADELGCPLIHDADSANRHRISDFSTVLVKYGVLKFSDHREHVLRILERATRVISLENDYVMERDKRLRPPHEEWSTVEGRAHYVNWNILTRRGASAWTEEACPLPAPIESGVVYYGAARPGRHGSFARYFRDAPYPVTISTFRGAKQFRQICGERPEVIGAFHDPGGPARWPLTIYIEDEKSHTLYCSPATRFYECVMEGLAQVIDDAAVHTLRRAGVSVPEDWIVNSQRGVLHALKHWREIQRRQRALWFCNYAEQLRSQFRAAVAGRLP